MVKVGRTVALEALDTPGHTMSHVCLLSHADTPALFCGDTLFNAGAGNCHNGGHPHELYQTFVRQLAKLPDATRIYPGHDYWENNLGFTLDREPDNARAAELLEEVSRARPRRRPGVDPGAREGDQHVLPSHQSERRRDVARGVPRPPRAARSEDRLPQAARAAQPLVSHGPTTTIRRNGLHPRRGTGGPDPCAVKTPWIPAFAGMTVRTALAGTPPAVVPSMRGSPSASWWTGKAGMPAGGVPG